MPISQTAEGLALRLLASYPGVPASKMAVVAIAEALDRIGMDIAEQVVDRARTEIVKVPSVAQLYEVAREVRTEAPRQVPMLSPGEFLAEMPADVKARVIAMQERWAEEIEDTREADEAAWQRKMGESVPGRERPR